MNIMNELFELSNLIKRHNEIDNEISALIGRPAHLGHTGEFIASKIFDVSLTESASQKSIDGHFHSGPLRDQTVNIKWFTSHDRLLNLCKDNQPDFYLVLTGCYHSPGSSKGKSRPWEIINVYLFESRPLVTTLKKAGVKIGTATSIRKYIWEAAEIFPKPTNQLLVVSQEQRELLSLFS
jgi:hypothetical protein